MELLDGEDLADRIKALGRIEPGYAVSIVRKVASALEAAHAKGIIHRDLKPENIFLTVDESCRETPKVVDFGIAWVTSRQSGPRLTQVGRVVGSPAYLSPEQARGELVDCRTDIWSLCVTLYECLTGAQPFVDPSQPTLLIKILYDNPVPITELGIGDERLWKIIEKGLRKDRNERWQSVAELATALESWTVLQSGRPATEVGQVAPEVAQGTPELREPVSPNDNSIPPAPAITVAPPPKPGRRQRFGVAALVSLCLVPLMLLGFVETVGSKVADAASQVSNAAEQVSLQSKRIAQSCSSAGVNVPVGAEAPRTIPAPEASAVVLVTRRPAQRKHSPDAMRNNGHPSIPSEPNF